ncbi:TPA: MoxR family ATPase [Enterococcus faecium]|uniref:AAA family ATPase n=3 Tax=Enterococcus faecium TaxID=1352 RepID=A0A1S8I4B0_ENTFC|nr:MoxR family ATPase [Enterococcus faecium]EOF60292.1 ATPase [Enterococcus faecium EnGen0124]EOF61287.1 ATPase [Enterococcus faecium EnGen0133]EOF65354.1 ATPase [Enterococcus faecium EnGen0126]EOF73926.1 ATPase [Enterococcus faecium EnGen0128]EOF74414.1 ATPase [Enterococcus faecium EnGen0132]EOF78208.1 ATPase [Enterococcus faecium EnGen0138]EOF80024.1 ATPase [Enterococcus faecium EnGen0137]EOF85219.1 ATPase [Enterococcus faecium EnGen0140]EOH44858.1 ATPase [Enterococcus faecium EnGen0189]
MIVALLAGGHVLFEDIPGVGKTLLVKALAKAVQGTFSRVQCTPDLLPSDILGFSVYNSQSKEFEFRPGPIFTTILLADEINRTTPRTQSALLEAMAENHATIDNNTYPLDNHFFVLATQNPIEYEGTYPLPEAQLDRFLFRLQIGYPSFDDELLLLLDKFEKVLDNLNEVLNSYEIEEIKTNVANVFVSPEVASYALQLVSATRSHAAIQLGISPRGSLSFIQAAKAYALIHGRNYVTPKDLQDLVPYVFSHRLIFYDRSLKEDEKKQIIHTLVAQIPVPVR